MEREKFSFDTFLEDPSNQKALAACRAFAAGGAGSGPLLLYGEPGCGKTHLFGAIAQQAAKKVGCFTAEALLEALVQDYMLGRPYADSMENLCGQYDIVLIEGIEVFCGRLASQGAFFRMAGRFCAAGKQLAVTASVLPEAFPDFFEGFRVHFPEGVLCGIGAPGTALKKAYAARAAAELGLALDAEETERIAVQHARLGAIKGTLLRLRLPICTD